MTKTATTLTDGSGLVVVDKPHFLATTPRGVHVRQTALVRLRETLGLPELAPVHRLDRLTAGVVVFTTPDSIDDQLVARTITAALAELDYFIANWKAISAGELPPR